jgi:phosphotransferase system IIA component
MSELELFLLIGVLTLNFNTVDFVKILEKNKKTSHSDHSGHIEADVMQNHEQKKEKWNKVKNQDFMGKTNYLLRTLPFSPWAVSATWLHVGTPQKIQENWS